MASRLGVEPLDLVDRQLEADQVVRREAVEDPVARLAVDPELGEQLAVEVGVAEPDHGARQPAASSAALSTSITSAVPSGAGAPISSTPAWVNSRIWPRCGLTAR